MTISTREDIMETARIFELTTQEGGLKAEHFTRFITQLEASPKTISIYARSLKQMKDYLGDNTRPCRADIRAYRDHLKTYLKPRSVQLYMTVCRQFFQWMEAEGMYRDVTIRIKGAKVGNSHSKDHLTPDQAKDIISATDNPRDRAIILLMFTAGIRCIEVVRANIGDIRNLGNDAVLFLQGKGRESADDWVKLPNMTHKAILEYLNTRIDPVGEKPLFASYSNHNSQGRLTTASVSRIVKTAMRKAGYDSDRWTAHSLRHTTATMNLIAGGTIQETQQLLRHKSINTTMIYLHNLDRMNNNSEARIEQALFGSQ
jgi:integrase/recombinase XerD